MLRRLFVVSYDIRDKKRLKRALGVVRDYASGGQYSCYECYLSTAEQLELIGRMQQIMADEDGLFVIEISQPYIVTTLGKAQLPQDLEIFILN